MISPPVLYSWNGSLRNNLVRKEQPLESNFMNLYFRPSLRFSPYLPPYLHFPTHFLPSPLLSTLERFEPRTKQFEPGNVVFIYLRLFHLLLLLLLLFLFFPFLFFFSPLLLPPSLLACFILNKTRARCFRATRN